MFSLSKNATTRIWYALNSGWNVRAIKINVGLVETKFVQLKLISLINT